MKAFQYVRQLLLIPGQLTEPTRSGEVPLGHPPARQTDKSPLDVRQLDDRQRYALSRRGRLRRRSGVAGIDIRQGDRCPGFRPHGGGEFGDLAAILLIGRRHLQRQQVSRGIDGQVDLAHRAAFGPVRTASMPAFRSALQRQAIKNHRGRLRNPPAPDPNQLPQIGHDRTKDIGRDPASAGDRPARSATEDQTGQCTAGR